MRLGDLDALRDEMQEYVFPITTNNLMGAADAYYRTIHLIEDAPTIDPEELRPKGRWLSAYEYALKIGVADAERLKEAAEDKWWKFCNDCGQPVKGFHNYCPNCGAKMIGGEQDG